MRRNLGKSRKKCKTGKRKTCKRKTCKRKTCKRRTGKRKTGKRMRGGGDGTRFVLEYLNNRNDLGVSGLQEKLDVIMDNHELKKNLETELRRHQGVWGRAKGHNVDFILNKLRCLAVSPQLVSEYSDLLERQDNMNPNSPDFKKITRGLSPHCIKVLNQKALTEGFDQEVARSRF